MVFCTPLYTIISGVLRRNSYKYAIMSNCSKYLFEIRAEYCTCSNLNEKTYFPTLEIERNINLNDYDENIHEVVREIHEFKAQRKRLPDYLKPLQVRELLEFETRGQRRKYLAFLFKKEKMKRAQIEKKAIRSKEREERKHNSLLKDENSYVNFKNTMLLRIREKSMLKFYNKRLASASIFGQKIVIDLDYDDYMWKKERRHCVAQLTYLYGVNRQSRYPFDLYICNAKASNHCVQYLKEGIPNIENSLITLTECNYLDIFPKENLVYLSPHAKDTLDVYDHSAVYIIGGFVDTVQRKPLSSHKADIEGIKSYALPLDKYILWNSASKSLTINQVFEIMLEMKNSGDWKKALKCVPTRKIERLKENDEALKFLSDKIFLLDTSENKSDSS